MIISFSCKDINNLINVEPNGDTEESYQSCILVHFLMKHCSRFTSDRMYWKLEVDV